MSERLHPKVVVSEDSPNQSARSAPISLIVVHSTESHNRPDSAADLQGVADWFANPAAQVSAHVVTDADGHSARCVPDTRKAWHCVSYNSAALGVEQIGQAAQGSWAESEWTETARWVAEWSLKHEIPIRRAIVAGGRVLRSGVTTHHRLGSYGGGHVDPGPNYPMRRMLRKARQIKKARRA